MHQQMGSKGRTEGNQRHHRHRGSNHRAKEEALKGGEWHEKGEDLLDGKATNCNSLYRFMRPENKPIYDKTNYLLAGIVTKQIYFDVFNNNSAEVPDNSSSATASRGFRKGSRLSADNYWTHLPYPGWVEQAE